MTHREKLTLNLLTHKLVQLFRDYLCNNQLLFHRENTTRKSKKQRAKANGNEGREIQEIYSVPVRIPIYKCTYGNFAIENSSIHACGCGEFSKD